MTISLLVITVLFALIFMYLPDVHINWRDVSVGAFITACLFVAGKFAIGFYLGTSDVGSAYGVAGSLILILAWIYYSSLIVFFGAEFTQVCSNRRVEPAQPVTGAEPAPGPGPYHRPRREAPGVVVVGAFISGWLAGRSRSN